MFSKKKLRPKTSKAEKNFGKWLNTIKVRCITQFKIRTKYYDFKVKDINLIIEFHGDYYHANPKLYENKKLNKMQIKNKANDEYKRALASINGFDIIYIWEKDFNTNKTKVKTQILNKLEELKNKEVKHLDTK